MRKCILLVLIVACCGSSTIGQAIATLQTGLSSNASGVVIPACIEPGKLTFCTSSFRKLPSPDTSYFKIMFKKK